MSIYFTLILVFFSRTSLETGRVIITLYALKLGAQPFTVGMLAAILSAVPTLISWQVGKVTDRVGSRPPILLCTVAGVIGMLVPYAIPGLSSLFVAAMMFGLMSALSAAPLQNLVGLQSKPQDRARDFSNLGLVTSTSTFAGPLMAGFTFDHAGPGMACLGLVVLLLVPAVLLVVWGGNLPGGTRTTKPTGSVYTLLSESGLWRVLVTSGFVVMCIDVFQVYIPIYGYGIGLSASAIGTILAMYSLAAFVARFFIPVLIARLTAERLLAYSFLIGAAGFLLIPCFKFENILILSLVSFIFGLGMGFGQPITLMMTFTGAAQGRSGESVGLRFTANNLMRAIGQVVFGSLSSALGVFSIFWFNAFILASGSVLSHPRTFRRRDDGS